MVGQARKGLYCKKKLNIFIYLIWKNRTVLTCLNFILKRFVIFVFIEKCFLLIFYLYGHGKLDLKFVHGRAGK